MTSYIDSLQRVFEENYRKPEFQNFLPRLAAEFPELVPEPTDAESFEDKLRDKLKHNARLQQMIAYAVNYVPSRWLLEQERLLVLQRRRLFGQHYSGRCHREDIYEWANRNRLAGLCLSGGGIRSATFNLGLIQSLATRGWLPSFDYLSSVSGGGYIHGWLAAWLKRKSDALAARTKPVGLAPNPLGDPGAKIPPWHAAAAADAMKEVQIQLCPLSEQEGRAAKPSAAFCGMRLGAKAHSTARSTPRSFWPEEIKWLRRYSNYLTPETGFLSLDSWAAAAVWIRNTFLNQLVLIAMLLFALLLLQAFCRPTGNGRHLLPLTEPMGVAGTAKGQLDAHATHLASFALQLRLTPEPGQPLTLDTFTSDFKKNFSEAFAWMHGPEQRFPPEARGQERAVGGTPPPCLDAQAVAPGTTTTVCEDRMIESRWRATAAGAATRRFSLVLAAAFFLGSVGFAVLFHHEWVGIHAADLAAERSGIEAGEACAVGSSGEKARRRKRVPSGLLIMIAGSLVIPSWPVLYQVLYASYGWRTEALVLTALVFLSVMSSIGGCAWSTLRISKFFAPHASVTDWSAKKFLLWLRHATCWIVPPVMATMLFIVVSSLLRTALQEGWGARWVGNHAQPGVEVTVGIPLLSTLPFLMLVLQAGITGSLVEDWVLELFARLRAMAVLFGLGSMLLFAIALLSPALFAHLFASKILTLSSIAAWVATTAGGVISGRSARVSGEPTAKNALGTSSAELLATVAPYVYIVGLLVLLACVAQWCVGLPWSAHRYLLSLVLTGGIFAIFGAAMDATTFSMFPFYRDRLTRCYLGASNASRDPLPLSGFDNRDTKGLLLQCLQPRQGYPGPIPLFCATINLTTGEDLAYQERKGASFVFSPLLTGYVSPWTEGKGDTSFCGYVPTDEYAASSEIDLASAMAISGAAVSPNWGFHSKPATAFLMTMFNARLGRWVPNPRHQQSGIYRPPRSQPSLWQVLRELFGLSDDSSEFVYLSDGGHFDNMGLYELVRRRCQRIVISDAEQDATYTFEGISGAIRKCRIDFGVEIKLDLTTLRPADKPRFSSAHWIEGTIQYPDRLASGELLQGRILYIKSSLRGFPAAAKGSSAGGASAKPGTLPNLPGDLQGYWLQHDSFPHDNTLNQWFTEDQFESYRRLGQCIGDSLPERLFC